jgi:hypothetical protein
LFFFFKFFQTSYSYILSIFIVHLYVIVQSHIYPFSTSVHPVLTSLVIHLPLF